jgi:formate hydrogenlyase subunit 4
MITLTAFIHVLLALMLAPLLRAVINRTKAVFSGRQGPSLFQPYYDLFKLLRKGAVYSLTSTWLFKAGPVMSLVTCLAALFILPFAGRDGMVRFSGDLILFVYLLGLGRFFTVLAAMDTGSSFEGMGASREVYFSAIAEPALLLGLASIAGLTESVSLGRMYGSIHSEMFATNAGITLSLIAFSFLIVLLAENCRIPVDDPTTHLELTMIHEVMVLDHSGIDLAMIQYASALKLWLTGALLAGIIMPVTTGIWLADVAGSLGAMFLIAAVTGIIESIMARLRLLRVPQLLVVAIILSILSIFVFTR